MFIECLQREEQDFCPEVFLKAGMSGLSGTFFGMGNNYVRLEMVMHQPIFDIFMDRLGNLTSS